MRPKEGRRSGLSMVLLNCQDRTSYKYNDHERRGSSILAGVEMGGVNNSTKRLDGIVVDKSICCIIRRAEMDL